MKHKQQHTKIQWKEFLIKTRKHKSQRKYSKMLRIFSISHIFAVTLTKKKGTFETAVQKEHVCKWKKAPLSKHYRWSLKQENCSFTGIGILKMGKDRKFQRGEILKASSNPNFWALCLDSYNWFMMCSSTPRSSSRIARRNALAPLCRGNNNSLCWDSRYSWSKRQQEPVENISWQCSNSQQLGGSAVIHGFCLTWKQSLTIRAAQHWNPTGHVWKRCT